MNYLEQNTSRNYFRTKIDTALHRLLQRHQAEVYKVGAKVTTEICFGNRLFIPRDLENFIRRRRRSSQVRCK